MTGAAPGTGQEGTGQEGTGHEGVDRDRVDEDRVRAAVNAVPDPCSVTAGVPAGLDDMGLVRDVTISGPPGARRVVVAIRLTEPTCLMGHVFVPAARAAVRALPGVTEVDVRLDPDPGWSERDLRPAYRRRLLEARGLHREA